MDSLVAMFVHNTQFCAESDTNLFSVSHSNDQEM